MRRFRQKIKAEAKKNAALYFFYAIDLQYEKQ